VYTISLALTNFAELHFAESTNLPHRFWNATATQGSFLHVVLDVDELWVLPFYMT
jgi:hypothetical protein